MATLSLLEFLVICAMPFFYGAATRLPFIYFVIHLRNHFVLDFFTIGLYVAAYQGARVVTSALSILTPQLSHLLGATAGLAGYIIVFVCDKDIVAPFVVGTALVGFSETMSSMQKYAKEMYRSDPDRKKGALMLKYQYACVMIGVVVAFSVGGVVYQFHGINGVAIFGIIIEGSGLLSLIIYHIKVQMGDSLEDKAVKNDGIDNVADSDVSLPNFSQDLSKKENQTNATSRRKSISKRFSLQDRLSDMLLTTNEEYSTADIPPTWVNWLLCMSFGIEALTIGYNLSIGPIFILNQFGKPVGTIGVLFAVGAASGSIAAIGATCTEAGRNLMYKIAASPFDICFAMGGIALGVLVAAVPNFVVHVIGLVLLMCFNDLGATLMTELQGSITTTSSYSMLGPLGQVVRRCLNVITAFTGPVLFEIFPRLPYFVAGIITLLWTIMLYVAFKVRTERVTQEIADKSGRRTQSVRYRMSFKTMEAVHTMHKLGGDEN